MRNLRVFFAIIPPRSTLNAIENALNLIKPLDLRQYIHWVNLEKLHITLQFLKRVELEQVPF